jgi:dienelactone hydrolase
VRFGPANRLFGILSVPDDTTRAPAVVFLTTNFEYHVGPHRLYVALAREYAALGHVVLRYDLGGVGDSEPPAGAAANIAYPAHAIDDAREAVAFLRAKAPGRRVIAIGLCSGAWHAFRAALGGLDIDAIVSVNPPLYLRDGRSHAQEYQEVGAYRSAMRDRARWANALRGRIAYGNLVRFCAGYVKRKAVASVRSLLGGRWREGLARELDVISARGITSLFVFSHGDTGLEYFRLCASATLVRRRAQGRIRYCVVDGAGHTFSPADAQRTLRMLLIDFVAQETRREVGAR